MALVQAYLCPDLVRKQAVRTPPENIRRQFTVYTDSQAGQMAADFWRVLAPPAAR